MHGVVQLPLSLYGCEVRDHPLAEWQGDTVIEGDFDGAERLTLEPRRFREVEVRVGNGACGDAVTGDGHDRLLRHRRPESALPRFEEGRTLPTVGLIT